jgi:L-ribulose-5-phosphate 4-epimerase
MSDEMIKGNYEYETGFQIMNCFAAKRLDYAEVEMVLVGNHAPFTWVKMRIRLCITVLCWKL